jgi:hypothetical protein
MSEQLFYMALGAIYILAMPIVIFRTIELIQERNTHKKWIQRMLSRVDKEQEINNYLTESYEKCINHNGAI